MEKKKKKASGRDVRGRGELSKIFEFYTLLATRFALRLQRVRRREERVRVLQALRCLRR